MFHEWFCKAKLKFFPSISETVCKISVLPLRLRQMLGSVISIQAWQRHSPYAFVPVFQVLETLHFSASFPRKE